MLAALFGSKAKLNVVTAHRLRMVHRYIVLLRRFTFAYAIGRRRANNCKVFVNLRYLIT